MVETILGILNLILKRACVFDKNSKKKSRKLTFTYKLHIIQEKVTN